MKVLSIISSGYRATLEEQDDTVVWITQAMNRAGAEIDILLRSAAANYVVEGQAAGSLAIGGRAQRNPPDVHGQVRDLAEHGTAIFVLEEDLAAYGLLALPRLERAQTVSVGELPELISRYDTLWHW
jgi:hypothetical protein